MADKPESRPEPALLFIGAAVFAAILMHALVTGWVWIPGSSRGGGTGHWVNRSDRLWDYVIYLVIVGGATLGVLLMALDRRRKFNRQGTGRR